MGYPSILNCLASSLYLSIEQSMLKTLTFALYLLRIFLNLFHLGFNFLQYPHQLATNATKQGLLSAKADSICVSSENPSNTAW